MQPRKPFGPSMQQHVGPVYDWTPERMRGVRGQETLGVRYAQAAQQGRFLAGLGDEAMNNEYAPEPDYTGTDELAAFETQNDVYGSGIFDGERREATANADAGVFASAYSLPGYLAREQPFQVSRELVSLPSGAEVVTVPAGGMSYVEREGRSAPPVRPGEIPRRPQMITESRERGRLATYANVLDYPTENTTEGELPGRESIALPVPAQSPYPASYVPEVDRLSKDPRAPRLTTPLREGAMALLPPGTSLIEARQPMVESSAETTSIGVMALPNYFGPSGHGAQGQRRLGYASAVAQRVRQAEARGDFAALAELAPVRAQLEGVQRMGRPLGRPSMRPVAMRGLGATEGGFLNMTATEWAAVGLVVAVAGGIFYRSRKKR